MRWFLLAAALLLSACAAGDPPPVPHGPWQAINSNGPQIPMWGPNKGGIAQ